MVKWDGPKRGTVSLDICQLRKTNHCLCSLLPQNHPKDWLFCSKREKKKIEALVQMEWDRESERKMTFNPHAVRWSSANQTKCRDRGTLLCVYVQFSNDFVSSVLLSGFSVVVMGKGVGCCSCYLFLFKNMPSLQNSLHFCKQDVRQDSFLKLNHKHLHVLENRKAFKNEWSGMCRFLMRGGE